MSNYYKHEFADVLPDLPRIELPLYNRIVPGYESSRLTYHDIGRLPLHSIPGAVAMNIMKDIDIEALFSADKAMNKKEDKNVPINLGQHNGTIICICGFADDDGNCIRCEGCGTWQHAHCYYPRVGLGFLNAHHPPLDYHCLDCSPRRLDMEAAKTIQNVQYAVKTGAFGTSENLIGSDNSLPWPKFPSSWRNPGS